MDDTLQEFLAAIFAKGLRVSLHAFRHLPTDHIVVHVWDHAGKFIIDRVERKAFDAGGDTGRLFLVRLLEKIDRELSPPPTS